MGKALCGTERSPHEGSIDGVPVREDALSGDLKSNVIIRKADISCAGGIAHVHVEAWRTTYRGQVPDDHLDRLSASDRAKVWEAEISREVSGVLVVEDRDHICGFINFGASRDEDADDQTGEIYAIYLLAETQRAGIGRKLWNGAIEELKKRGFAKCVVWVLNTNCSAICFYERMGCCAEGSMKSESIGGKKVTELRYQVSLA